MAFVLFPTAFGACGFAWGGGGITRFQLPEETEARTASRLSSAGGARIAEDGAPDWVRRVIARVQLHMRGEPQDFSDLAIDWSLVGDFRRGVYRQAQSIKPGYERSYGDIARALAPGPGSARAVGAALASNPWPLLVPCHRVVSAGGRMTGFSGPGGVRTKTRLLALERAELLSE